VSEREGLDLLEEGRKLCAESGRDDFSSVGLAVHLGLLPPFSAHDPWEQPPESHPELEQALERLADQDLLTRRLKGGGTAPVIAFFSLSELGLRALEAEPEAVHPGKRRRQSELAG
jgi:hypothetical protein